MHKYDKAQLHQELDDVSTLHICRCCNQPITPVYQKPIRRGGREYWLLTCENKTCGLYGHTFTLCNYSTVDLTPYYAVRGG